MIFYRRGYAGLYIHFPYCIHKCSYCDFYSVGVGKNSTPDQTDLFNNYRKEFDLRISLEPEILEYSFDTVFIGGGTPSLANLEMLSELMLYIKTKLKFADNTEFTMEMNPEDISPEKLGQLYELGVNRVNAGIQSFQKELLTQLERYNDEAKYSQVLTHLSNSKIKRFGIDLMYGIPGQTLEMFLSDLNKSIDAKVTHISLYSLTVEKGTEYAKKLKKKLALPPNEDLQLEILQTLPDLLRKKGYRHYEVSNYCKEGEESRHNLKYWTMEKYLSIGPGAHGFTDKGRYFNNRSIEKYNSGQFGLTYDSPVLLDELALCLFRLFIPFNLESFFVLVPEKKIPLENLIRRWTTLELCDYSNGIFHWKQNSITRLDELILEISEV